MARAKAKKENNGANLGFEAKLWAAADKLRGNMEHRPASLGKAHHFFEFTSRSMRLSGVRSATIFFSSVFPCSSSFSRFTSETSIPPYRFFQR